MRHDHTGQERLESLSSRGSDYGFYDTNLNDFEQHVTPADLCVWGKPSTKCTCSFCREQTAINRSGEEGVYRI